MSHLSAEQAARTAPRLVLAGCYGEHNLGDEALLASTLGYIRQRWPDAVVTVFSESPVQTAERYGVTALPSLGWLRLRNIIGLIRRRALLRILGAIWNCDCLIVGGGELLRSDFGLWSVLTIFDRICLAALLRKRVLLLGVGAGPLPAGLGRRIIVWGTRRAVLLTRDPESVRALAGIGLPHGHAMPDLAIGLRPGPHTVVLPRKPRVCFSLLAADRNPSSSALHLDRHTLVKCLAQAADQVLELGAVPVFLPFCLSASHDDRIFHREVVAGMKAAGQAVLIEDELSPEAVKGLMAEMDMVVAMRLHACVFAIGEKRPVIALSYDGKVRKVMSSLGGCTPTIPLERLSELSSVIPETWERREELAAALNTVIDDKRRQLDNAICDAFETIG